MEERWDIESTWCLLKKVGAVFSWISFKSLRLRGRLGRAAREQ